MPIAKIQAPDGKVLTIEVPEGATEEQILSFVQQQYTQQPTQQAAQPVQQPIAQQPQPEESAITDMLKGAGEAALTLGTGLGSTVAGGLAGLGSLVGGASPGEAADLVKQIQADYTYTPETEEAQQALGALGTVADLASGLTATGFSATPTFIASLIEGTNFQEDLGKITRGGWDEVANRVFQDTGSPVAATAATLLPDVLGALGGASAFQPAGTIARQSRIAAQAGRKAKNAQEIARQGIDERIVPAIREASDLDKKVIKDALGITKKSKQDLVFAQNNKPSQAVGDRLAKRVAFIEQQRKQASKDIGRAGERLKGMNVDTATPLDNFYQSLSDAGVRVEDGKLNFSGSDLEAFGPDKVLLNKLNNELKKVSGGNAYQAHKAKQIVSELVLAKKRDTALTRTSENIAKSLRADIKESLEGLDPVYDKANQRFSTAINALDSLRDVTGKRTDLFDDMSSKALGRKLRVLASNYDNRDRMFSAVRDIENATRELGGKFTDDINRQFAIVNEIEKQFRTRGQNTFEGLTERGVQNALSSREGLRGAITDIATQPIADRIQKIRGIDDENAIKAIEDLLDE